MDATASAAFRKTTAPGDAASEELGDAWQKAYGRNPDPSDAWDHAIKAVEAILIPIVVPNQAKPTLGHVIGHLDTQGHLWKLLLPGPGEDFSVDPLVAMLGLMSPGPSAEDRVLHEIKRRRHEREIKSAQTAAEQVPDIQTVKVSRGWHLFRGRAANKTQRQ